MDKVVAFGFVFCAFFAVFASLHAEEIRNGQFDEVVASYISGS